MVKGSGSSRQRQSGSSRQRQNQNAPGIDRTTLRIAVLGVLVVAAFVTLFSRLWFLQVLATDQYKALAKENRVRTVYSEPPRGRILDRNGSTLVENKESIAVTIDRETLQRHSLGMPAVSQRLHTSLCRLPMKSANAMRT
jgi:cell division protein FtsI/penicillin-binding protein 2